MAATMTALVLTATATTANSDNDSDARTGLLSASTPTTARTERCGARESVRRSVDGQRWRRLSALTEWRWLGGLVSPSVVIVVVLEAVVWVQRRRRWHTSVRVGKLIESENRQQITLTLIG